MDKLLTPDELATHLHTTTARLAQDRYLGRGVPFVKHGKNVLYRESDVEKYLDMHRFIGTDGATAK